MKKQQVFSQSTSSKQLWLAIPFGLLCWSLNTTASFGQTVTEVQIEPTIAEDLEPPFVQLAEYPNPARSRIFRRQLGTDHEANDGVRDPKKPGGATASDYLKDGGPKPASKWFEKYSIRGYTQIRVNEPLFERFNSAPPQYVGDRSIGANQNFLARRIRVILAGDINDYAYLYFQPDFASTPPGSSDQTLFAQIRDAYADLYLDKEKEFRFRVGQSKVPYGFENMQSSSNRLPLDRNDALNSAVRNERDLGVFFYYTPKPAQEFFKYVIDEGLKGSGNYGVFGLGVYNGQGGSFVEQNDNLHLISRLALPFEIQSGQLIELAVQGYIGEYTVFSAPIRRLGAGDLNYRPLGALDTGNPQGWNDKRLATTFVLYPRPFGLATEWTVGRGPALDDMQLAIEDRALYGGYVLLNYMIETPYDAIVFPFCRWSYFRGGYKSERNAPFAEVNEWEFGTEWQFHAAAELTTSYLITDRTNTSPSTPLGVAPYQQFSGHVMRFQLQFNY